MGVGVTQYRCPSRLVGRLHWKASLTSSVKSRDQFCIAVNHPRLAQQEANMIKLLARLFIVWVAIIFVASANEEILHGRQQLVEASNEAASAATGHAVFPPVERESRTANNALNTEKEARLQTDESDDDLLTIGLGTRGAYPSYPSSFGSDAPITRETWGNSATHEQEDARGTKRKISNSWGSFLSLKTGVTLHENEAQDSYATQDFLSDLLSKQPIRLSSEENNIATPQFIPQEIQQVSRIFQLGSNAPSYQNAGGSNSPVLPKCTFLNSGNQGSSSENPEHIPQASKMPKTHQLETIMAIGNHPIQIDGITNYGRLKFNTDLFRGEGQHQLERRNIVTLLNSIPLPRQGKFSLTYNQLVMACGILKRKPLIKSKLRMLQIRGFMDNIQKWYQYWNTHAKIELEILHHMGQELSSLQFVFPLFLLYVEMIISIIPFKPDIPLEGKLDYPQEMRNAINSYQKLNMLMKTPPENGESTILKEKQWSFYHSSRCASQRPSGILWNFIEFWMESNYKAVWNEVKEFNNLHARKAVKSFFDTIFSYGIETLNENLGYFLPHE
ncbi:uncharacterized protein VP01_2420g1 [Puccinia sorghi]|uniref:Uncharacterized protein n=1 Tax=Puccinia sorghi TaxID=27349 RepID=A0A0L6V774_9BASI|nr:uncharacterized protein VP01_2420g1 [Puccinia sorghi]